METQTRTPESHHGKGQTLAEFALTLPILLLLLFGIIEFGRLFQSWVTLQNAARTAVRYASTGQYKEDRYDIGSLVVCTQQTSVDTVGPIVPVNYPRGRGYDPVQIFQYGTPAGDDESFYATWYGQPLGCEPGPDTDQNRKDILRLPSIYEEARRGAAGLLIENSLVSPNLASVKDYLFSQFQRPHPDIDKLDWFDVVVCSSRNKIYDDDTTRIIDVVTGSETIVDNDTARFELVLDDDDYAPAACVLREAPIPSRETEIPANGLKPWMDAGGPGQRVTVVITLNHRLITPIGLAEFVKLQAQRSAINESFRVTNAERALGPAGSPPDGLPQTPTPLAATDTPLPTSTNTPLPSATATETDFPTETPAPFTCDNIDVFFRSVPFDRNRLFIEFANFNYEESYLLESDIFWDKTPVETDFPNFHMASMALDNEGYWAGPDYVAPTYANSEGTLFYDPSTRDHNLFIPPGGDKIYWQGMFIGPSLLSTYFDIYDFSGTSFVFDNPDSDEDCRVLVYTPPVPTPTLEPEGYESPTPTYTPDCASLTLSVEFVSLEVAGDVTLRVINDGPVNAPFNGFNIVWPVMSGIGLDKVVFGGRNALDTPDVGGSAVVMWDSPVGGGDQSPPTSSTEPGWITDVTVPAFSNTLVHLDFVGVAGRLPVSPSDFNGTRLDIWCGTVGTGFGNGGGGNGGSIFLAEENTPVPTNLPPPTWTPISETYTPTNTPPPAIPTNTRTPLPIVDTPTPEPTDIPDTATPEEDIDIDNCVVDGVYVC